MGWLDGIVGWLGGWMSETLPGGWLIDYQEGGSRFVELCFGKQTSG